MNPTRLSTAEIVARLERCLAGSPADATEISWTELRSFAASSRRQPPETATDDEPSIVIRVRESSRSGSQRTRDREPADLNATLRYALAQCRLGPTVAQHRLAEGAPATPSALQDEELATLSPTQAHERLSRMAQQDEILRLRWAWGRAVAINSAGLRATAEATAATFEALCGDQAGAGRAAASSRRLADLNLEQIVGRARSRHPEQGAATDSFPESAPKVVLAPEAAAALIDLFNRRALTSLAFSQGGADLFGGIGQSIVSATCALRDDGTDPAGMPFPFDLFGHAKQPIDLIARGILLTPALSGPLAATLGREPTPHEVAPEEAVASHVGFLAGGAREEDLLRTIEDGVWISSISALVGVGARGLPFRCRAQGVRRIRNGTLGGPLPDAIWDDHLMAILGNLLEVGDERVAIANPDGFSGATRAPALALQATQPLRAGS